MSRLTQRVTAVWSTVKCPRCGARVDPNNLGSGDQSAQPPADSEKRWSFVWTPPRGDFCPECEFPMSKYFGRIKWIRTFGVGIVMVLLFVTMQIIGSVARIGEAFTVTMQILVALGGIISIIGIVGIIVGGKRAAVRAADWSKPG